MSIPLLSDSRNEFKRDTPGWLDDELRSFGFTVYRRQLTTADLIWSIPGGRCGCEIKVLDDLTDSHTNGRLDDELFRLLRSFRLPILLVVGPLDNELDVPDVGGWTFNSVDNMLLGRQRRGIYAAKCSHLDALPERIHSLVRYTQRSPRQQRTKRSRQFAYQGPLTGRAEVMYAVLTSVGKIRNKVTVAEKLAAKYSLHELALLPVETLIAEGFTKLMARRVYSFLRDKEA